MTVYVVCVQHEPDTDVEFLTAFTDENNAHEFAEMLEDKYYVKSVEVDEWAKKE